MFRRNRDQRVHRQALIIANLQEQERQLRAQLEQQSREAARRIAELERERNEWRGVAQDWEKHHESARHD